MGRRRPHENFGFFSVRFWMKKNKSFYDKFWDDPNKIPVLKGDTEPPSETSGLPCHGQRW